MSCLVKPGIYDLKVYDNEIDVKQQQEVFDFLLDSEYCVNFYDQNHCNWYPRSDRWEMPRTKPAGLRLPLAWDDLSLKHRAPVVYELWTKMQTFLDGRYVIEGIPESMNYMTDISPLSGIPRSDGSPGAPNSAWRVYGDGIDREYRARSKSVHRDNPFLDDDTAYTLVYFANTEWHPQLYGETLFHGNDSSTGDFTGKYEQDQPRNFPIGDVENVVAPRPGRIMIWDSRYMHQIKPAASYADMPLMVISFRVKKVSAY